MEVTIIPSSIKGKLHAPSSKSEMQRVVASALLAKGESIIDNPSFCDDANVSLRIAEHLGANISFSHNQIAIKGGLQTKQHELNFGESALALRMFTPIAGLCGTNYVLTGEKSLFHRPINFLIDTLKPFGLEFSFENNSLPISLRGKLTANSVNISGRESSQVLTGLLMALPCLTNQSIINVENLKSKPYILLTLDVLKKFGIQIEANNDLSEFKIPGKQNYLPQNYKLEGDWSGMSFMIVAAAIAGNISIIGLNKNSKQSDIELLKVLQKVGVDYCWNQDILEIQKNKLESFDFDATDCPDLFPPLVSLASHCKGISKISGVHRLQYKESSRGITLKNEFAKLGIRIEIQNDEMLVYGGQLTGGVVESHGDHRIAMALAIAGLRANNEIKIREADCVSKSYPKFFEDLHTLQCSEI